MITVTAMLVDCVNRLLCYSNYTPSTTKVIAFDNCHSKEVISQSLKDCLNFEIDDDQIHITVKRTEAEIQEDKNGAENRVKYEINTLKRRCELSIEEREKVFTYLKFKKLDWIVEKLR